MNSFYFQLVDYYFKIFISNLKKRQRHLGMAFCIGLPKICNLGTKVFTTQLQDQSKNEINEIKCKIFYNFV